MEDKIIRSASGVEQFCREKYGTAFPRKTEFGYITWNNVPIFARHIYPGHLSTVPYLITGDEYLIEQQYLIEQEIEDHYKNRPLLSGSPMHTFYSGKKKMHYKNSEHQRIAEEWFKEHEDLRNKLRSIGTGKLDSKRLTPEQLECLGINFYPYLHPKE